MKIMKAIKQTTIWWQLMVLALLVAGTGSGLTAKGQDTTLTTAVQVRSLTAAEAEKGLPVKLQGVVTFYEDPLFSRFVQDATAGIYLLELTNQAALSPGQLVEVIGTTGPGEYAPVVQPTSIKAVGKAKLPPAKTVTLEELVSGQYDSQLVEFSGTVRAVHFDPDTGYYLIDFAKGNERFTAYAKKLPAAEPQDLVESTVKVTGVCATMFNHQRQLFGVRLLVPEADGVVIVKPAPTQPFDQPAHPISSLLQFAPEGSFAGRVKVSGTVVFCDPGNAIFLQDEKAGLYCQTLQRDEVLPGDQVEVLGFPAKGEYTPILEDAIYRKVSPGNPPQPADVDVNEILTGIHDCRLVQLPAQVLGTVERGLNRFLLLQAGGFTFQAYLPNRINGTELGQIQQGSQVKATGICMIERGNQWQAGNQWRAASFRLLLRSPEDVTVVQGPATMKLPDNTGLLIGMGVIASVSLLWVVALRRKIRHQSRMLVQK
jgi:hypothetical protein